MSKTSLRARFGLVISPSDLAALDRLAVREEISRAAYARRIIRAHLRQAAAQQEPATTT